MQRLKGAQLVFSGVHCLRYCFRLVEGGFEGRRVGEESGRRQLNSLASAMISVQLGNIYMHVLPAFGMLVSLIPLDFEHS